MPGSSDLHASAACVITRRYANGGSPEACIAKTGVTLLEAPSALSCNKLADYFLTTRRLNPWPETPDKEISHACPAVD
jgi:hypothetical protein